MKFEKGDIVYWMGSDKAFGIVLGECKHYKGSYRLYANGSYDSHSSCSGKNLRHATHDEKGLLITALAKENKYYCEKTKTIKEMKKEFTKKDLKSGMWVELRNGDKYLVITDAVCPKGRTQKFILIRDNKFLDAREFSNDLTAIGDNSLSFDIIKVLSIGNGYVNSKTYKGEDLNVIWERETQEDKQFDKMQEKLKELREVSERLSKELNETLAKLKEFDK